MPAALSECRQLAPCSCTLPPHHTLTARCHRLQMYNGNGDMRLALQACSMAAEVAAKAAAAAAARESAAAVGGQGSKDGVECSSPTSAPPKPASKLVGMPHMAEALNTVCGASVLRCAALWGVLLRCPGLDGHPPLCPLWAPSGSRCSRHCTMCLPHRRRHGRVQEDG